MINYTKRHLTVDGQIGLLKNRGMAIPDMERAVHYLQSVGYYRLAGYWHGMRILVEGETGRRSEFVRQANFERVIEIYEFDRKLRLLVFDAIERIEVMLRFQIAYVIGDVDAYAHRSPDIYTEWFRKELVDGENGFDKLISRVNREETRSREIFATHHIEKYGKPLPIWKASEILEFRTIGEIYRGLGQKLADIIAKNLNVTTKDGNGNSGKFGNWLTHLGYVRNICAHHSRLWNRNMAERIQPGSFKGFIEYPDAFGLYRDFQLEDGKPSMTRVYTTLVLIAILLDQIDPNNGWRSNIIKLVETDFPAGHSLMEMGFPENFEKLPFWAPK